MSSAVALTVDEFLADPTKGLELVDRVREGIPFLDQLPAHAIGGQLLRYRGMIQDMPNPVFYYESYGVENTRTGFVGRRSGKFRDGLVCGDEEKLCLGPEETVSSERRPYFCVGIPALNSWARTRSSGKWSEETTCESSSRTSKRSVEEMEADDEVEQKRQCAAANRVVEGGNCLRELPWDNACVVHVYEPTHWESLKVNDIVDVVGFAYVSSADQDDVEIPPSLAPRLHVIALSVVNHVNILPNPSQALENAAALRNELHLSLAQLLLGDHLAADYLICHLLANVYHRRDLTVLGKFSLNLSNVPLDQLYISGLYDILSLLVPKSLFFSMSIQSMNASDLVPSKDYETNRLKKGVLQLSDRTHLVIDETKLEAGKLVENGVRNVHILNTLLSEQVVNYDFKYYAVPFPANIPVLVLSEGKSLLQCDAQLKLCPDTCFDSNTQEIIHAVQCYLKEPLLSSVRAYLCTLPAQDFAIPDDLSSTIQNDFVQMRQDNSKMTAEDMHTHLVLARLLGLSFGHTVLTKELWDRAVQLEHARRTRL